jgi:hypothetical protein
MANNLQRVHGGSQEVFAIDTRNGSVTSLNPSGAEVNFIGPAMDFFGIATGVSMAGQMGPGGAVEAIAKQIAQLGTVMMYQVESGTGGFMSFAVYPKGAWEAATAVTGANLQASLAALTSVGVGPITLAATTVTDLGFKLAVA